MHSGELAPVAAVLEVKNGLQSLMRSGGAGLTGTRPSHGRRDAASHPSKHSSPGTPIRRQNQNKYKGELQVSESGSTAKPCNIEPAANTLLSHGCLNFRDVESLRSAAYREWER
jgi:hypothetical protein